VKLSVVEINAVFLLSPAMCAVTVTAFTGPSGDNAVNNQSGSLLQHGIFGETTQKKRSILNQSTSSESCNYFDYIWTLGR